MSATVKKADASQREAAKTVNMRRKEDAGDLALLIYDIFKENNEGDNVNNGQNDANQHNNAD